jgi:hypothetical protein
MLSHGNHVRLAVRQRAMVRGRRAWAESATAAPFTAEVGCCRACGAVKGTPASQAQPRATAMEGLCTCSRSSSCWIQGRGVVPVQGSRDVGRVGRRWGWVGLGVVREGGGRAPIAPSASSDFSRQRYAPVKMPQINPSAAPSLARDALSSSFVLWLQLPCLQSVAADRGEWEGRVDNDMRNKG